MRRHLSACLDASPSGGIRIISVCAGDGRDVLGAIADHRRRDDVRARLVEIDQHLVADGEAARDGLGLSESVEYVAGDATDPVSYEPVAPASIVMMCGMLGLVDRHELVNVVRTMRALCAPGGHVVWTRRLDWRDGREQTRCLLRSMADSRFRQEKYDVTSRAAPWSKSTKMRFGVGTHRFEGQPAVLADRRPLFTLSDAPIDR